MITKILSCAVSILLVFSVALGLLYGQANRTLIKERAALQTAVQGLQQAEKDRKLSAGILAARVKENASLARKLADAQQGLQNGLQANPAWAGTSVPPEVRASILSDSERSQSVPE